MTGSTYNFYRTHILDKIKHKKSLPISSLHWDIIRANSCTQIINDLSDFFDIIHEEKNPKAFADRNGWLVNFALSIAFENIPGFREKWLQKLGLPLSAEEKEELCTQLATTPCPNLNNQSVVWYLLKMCAEKNQKVWESLDKIKEEKPWLKPICNKLKEFYRAKLMGNKIIKTRQNKYPKLVLTQTKKKPRSPTLTSPSVRSGRLFYE